MDLSMNKIVILIVLTILISTSIIDTLVIRLSFYTGFSERVSDIIFFSILVAVFSVSQFFIIRFLKNKFETTTRPYLSRTHTAVSILQYFLISNYVIIIAQMVLTSSYNLLLLKMIVYSSGGLSVILLGFLAVRFISWFISTRDKLLFLYAIAMGILVVNIIFMITVVANGLNFRSEEVKYFKSLVAQIYYTVNIFDTIYFNSAIFSFVFFWLATVLLLRYHSKKMGKAKYWLLVCAPLFYFLSQFQSLVFDVFGSVRISNPVFYGIVFTLLFTLSKPIGGILFAMAFWVVSRSVSRHIIGEYLLITAFGIVLLFTANQTTSLVIAPFPPFGLVSFSLMSLSSYLLFLGIYSSAMSISRDTELRKFIHQTTTKEIKLLDSIGFAQVEQGLVNKIVPLVQKRAQNLEQETGIKTTLTDTDIKQYLEEILTEFRSPKDH